MGGGARHNWEKIPLCGVVTGNLHYISSLLISQMLIDTYQKMSAMK